MCASSPSSSPDLLRLAALAVRCALDGVPCEVTGTDAAGGGAFVTLRHRGELAGCIGYADAPPPRWQTVVQAAEAATLRDPRFPRLPAEAAVDLEIELSLLSESVPTAPDTFVPGVDGLILESPRGQGLLLPQVAEEHDLDRAGFLEALARKAGLSAGAWRDPDVELRAFTVTAVAGSLLELLREPEAPR